MDSGSGSSIVELGRFLTGFLVVMGIGMYSPEMREKWSLGNTDCLIALPVVLAHCAMIRPEAMVMSIVGGLLIYGTIISFTMFFREQEEF